MKAGQTFEYWEGQFDGFDDKSIITKVEADRLPHRASSRSSSRRRRSWPNLAMFTFGIASPKAVEKWGTEFGKHPVGTGAFKFVEWKPNQEVVLEANPDYWGQKAKVKRVVVRNIKDNSQRLAALEGRRDPRHRGAQPRRREGRAGRTRTSRSCCRPTNTTGYVAFNYKVKEFQDKRVRQAIAHAINKKAIVDALYGGTGLVATQFQPPPLWGYNKELKDYEYSPAKAQDLLKQAGLRRTGSARSPGTTARRSRWSSGTCRARARTSRTRRRSARRSPPTWPRSGIKAQLQTAEWAVYLDKRKNGQLPLYMLGWTGDNGDPDNFVCYFFCSPGASREGFYSNQPLADLLLRASTLTNQAERAKLYRQAEQMIHDDVARLFIANNRAAARLLEEGEGVRAEPDRRRSTSTRSSFSSVSETRAEDGER